MFRNQSINKFVTFDIFSSLSHRTVTSLKIELIDSWWVGGWYEKYTDINLWRADAECPLINVNDRLLCCQQPCCTVRADVHPGADGLVMRWQSIGSGWWAGGREREGGQVGHTVGLCAFRSQPCKTYCSAVHAQREGKLFDKTRSSNFIYLFKTVIFGIQNKLGSFSDHRCADYTTVVVSDTSNLRASENFQV